MFLQNNILERHLKIVARSLKANITKNKMNFRCNVCGDTEKSKNKKSAYLILRYNSKYNCDTWQFYCFRGSCGTSMLAEIWLKKYFPLNYTNYQKELLYISEETEEEIKEEELAYNALKQKEIAQNKIDEEECVKYFIPILEGSGEEFEEAKKICKDRLIDENIWKNWFVASNDKNKNNRYKNRLIIPFYDHQNEIYYWQGRALYDWMIPKYKNRKDNRDFAIYNYYNVDKNKEVIVVEGPIDSLFINNCIAILGTNITEKAKELIEDLNKFYLFDNDKAGYKKSLEYLLEGKYVFLWKKFLKDKRIYKEVKDVNEFIINFPKYNGKLNYDYLKKYFSNNIFDKIYLV